MQTEQASTYVFVTNQGEKGFVLVSAGQGEVRWEERPAGLLRCTWCCLLTTHSLSWGKKPLTHLQITFSWLNKVFPFPVLNLGHSTVTWFPIPSSACVCIYMCVHLTELPVPAVNLTARKIAYIPLLHCSLLIAHCSCKSFDLRRFPRDLLSVTQMEASSIKGKQHHVIITSTLTQSLKHNFYGFCVVLMCNTSTLCLKTYVLLT